MFIPGSMDGFEVIVISTLGLIYCAIRGGVWALGFFLVKINNDLVQIRRKLADEIKDKGDVVEIKGKDFIDIVFVFVVWAICLYELWPRG
jgi:hypothetical protein